MPAEQASREPATSTQTGLLESVMVPLLTAAQNVDGGWGYHAEAPSRVEPTSWAVLALDKHDREAHKDASERAKAWLRERQLRDGAWPARPGAQEGSWTTALACLGLLDDPASRAAEARGITWLCREYPREASWLWRLRYRLSGAGQLVRQDPTLHGWNWVAGTASWVEPTAYALLVLANAPGETLPAEAGKRRERAEAMLFDRMCPGGGWNLGNPQIYGVAGVPGVTTTSWALLALQGHADRPEVQQSLGWLEAVYGEIESSNSLSLAHLCLEAYGRPAAPLEPTLARLFSANQFLRDVRVGALATLALMPGRDCLRWKGRGGSR
jgi:hypothetical protein